MGPHGDRDSGFFATPSGPRGQGWPGATSSIAPPSLGTASILATGLFLTNKHTSHSGPKLQRKLKPFAKINPFFQIKGWCFHLTFQQRKKPLQDVLKPKKFISKKQTDQNYLSLCGVTF